MDSGHTSHGSLRKGQSEILGQEQSTLTPEASFLAPMGISGTLGSIPYGGSRKESGRSYLPGRLQRRENHWRALAGGCAITVGKPPWILLDKQKKTLVRLHPDPRSGQRPIEPIPVRDDEHVLQVHDAISWTGGALLLATDQGMKAFDIATGKIAPANLPAIERQVSRLCRDGLGRLWMGGDGLLMIDPDGKTVHSFDTVPMLGRSAIAALAADPAHPDGVAAAVLEQRGLIFVQARSSPRN